MQYQMPHSRSFADNKHQEDNERKKTVARDIQRIDTALETNSLESMQEIHQSIDGKYQACIKDWGLSMYCYTSQAGFYYEGLGVEALRENLKLMRSKLEAFAQGWNAVSEKNSLENHNTDVSVTVENSIQINITFDQVRSQVEDMTSLTAEQTQEILDKIDEIEKVVNSTDKKKTKWEKLKPTLAWLADKSCDVGIALLPLLLKIN